MGRAVALLRAVNVGGRKLPMAELRALCEELGWSGVATYVQSGNVVFTAEGEPRALERALEKAISERYGLDVPVIVRSSAQWSRYARRNPFPEAARHSPSLLLLHLSKSPPGEDAESAIQSRAADGEQVKRAGDALWIHYPNGSGRSKLTPRLIDKAIGSLSTSRNHNSVVKLQEMLDP